MTDFKISTGAGHWSWVCVTHFAEKLVTVPVEDRDALTLSQAQNVQGMVRLATSQTQR